MMITYWMMMIKHKSMQLWLDLGFNFISIGNFSDEELGRSFVSFYYYYYHLALIENLNRTISIPTSK